MLERPTFHLVSILQRGDQIISDFLKLLLQVLGVVLRKPTEYRRIVPSTDRRRYVQLLY